MIPNYKQQSETELRRISNDGKLLLKTEPTSANERESFVNTDYQLQADEEGGSRVDQEPQDIQYGGPKPQIFSINYAVPSGSLIPDHSAQQHPGESSRSYQQTSKGID